jgi:hypothetical protein
MDLREIGCERVDWIHQAQGLGSVAGSYICGNEPSGFIKGMEFIDSLSDRYLLRVLLPFNLFVS